MSGEVLASQTSINQNTVVAIPYSDRTKFFESTVTITSGTSATSVTLPSYVRLSDSSVPSIIVSDGVITTGQQPAYCAGYGSNSIILAPSTGGNWSGNYTYKYTILNQL